MAQSSTTATNAAAFAADEPLDDRGAARANGLSGVLSRPTEVRCSPARAARETARALGLQPVVDQGLGDWNLGRWAGHTLDAVAGTEPDAVRAWMLDPDAEPHGGECLTALLTRVGRWLDGLPSSGHTVAVTHAAVVRAAVVVVLTAPPAAFWRIDIAPLTATRLAGRPGRWTVRSTGERLEHPG